MGQSAPRRDERPDVGTCLPDLSSRSTGRPWGYGGAGRVVGMLKQGDTAPDFTLPDQDAKPVNLADLKGRKVLVYFYPKSD
jgi:cytochrome oxidase Cu insertion factor (SCO1/SenC/PrrC family)